MHISFIEVELQTPNHSRIVGNMRDAYIPCVGLRFFKKLCVEVILSMQVFLQLVQVLIR